jgi:WD40 repeat protein
VVGAVIGVASGVLVAASLDALKDAVMPNEASWWLSVGALVTGAVVGYTIDRTMGRWIDARYGSETAVVDTVSDVDQHFDPRGRGVMSASQVEHRFQGRRAALTEINAWLVSDRPSSLLVVTGDPGSGKSAVLGRLVVTADPARRRRLPRRDRGVRAPLRSVACEVHAKGATVEDVAAEIGAELGAAGRVTPSSLPTVLRERLHGRKRRFVVLLDALDEAVDPRAMIREVLRPLLDASPSLGIRVVVGTRRNDDRGSLAAALATSRIEIDLDADKYFARQDLTAYALACLQVRKDGAYQEEFRARALATAISRRSGHSFLVAGLMATHHGLHDTHPVRPRDLTGGVSLAEVLDEFLSRLGAGAGAPARDLLVPLAFARAPGLPLTLWRDLVHALTGRTTTTAELSKFVRSAAANLLVTTGTARDPEPVYRLFHQALNDTIVAERARHDLIDRDHQVMADTLHAAVPATGWKDAPSYLTRSLGDHLVAAGRVTEIEDILDGTDFLLHADLPRLHAALDGLSSQRAVEYRRLIGTTPNAEALGVEHRAAAFSITAVQAASPRFRDVIARLTTDMDLPYRAVWARLPQADVLAQTMTGNTGTIAAVALTPDGSRAVTGSNDKTVRVWDLATGTEQAVLTGHTGEVLAVAVTQDGSRAVTGSDDRTVRVWDLETGTEQTVLTSNGGDVWAVALTPDRNRVVAGSIDGTVRIWNLETGTEQAVLTGHTGAVSAVALTPDGNRAVTGSRDQTVRIWNLETGTEQAVLTGHTGSVSAVALTPDGNRAVTGSIDGTVRIWNLETGTEQAVLTGHTGAVSAVAVTPDGNRAVTGSRDQTVRIWNLETGTEQAVLTGHTGEVSAVATTPDGNRAVTGSGDETVRVWNLPDGSERAFLTGHIVVANAVETTPDGNRAVTGSGDGTVRVWELAAGTEQAVLTGHTGPVLAVALTPDGSRAVTGSRDQTVRVWDLTTGTEQAVLTGHTGEVLAVAVTPDGNRAVTGSRDQTVRVWDLTTGTEQAVLTGHTGSVFAVAITPDGSRAVTGSGDAKMLVWDLATGTEQSGAMGHWGAVFAVAITPDGSRTVSGSIDQTVLIWDHLETGNDSTVLTGHAGKVWAVAITPDGRRAVTGSNDQTVQIWDLVTGTARQIIEVPAQVNGIAISGSTVVLALSLGILALEVDWDYGSSDDGP